MTLTAQPEPTDLSFALASLQQVAASLRRARSGWIPSREERSQLLSLMRTVGPSVFPQLLRSLASDSDDEASWAGQLLRQANMPEVAARLGKLLTSPSHSDVVKARALAIVADLGLTPPQDVALANPEQFIADSVAELLSTIESPSDLRRATDDLLGSVPEDELSSVLREVVCHGGQQGQSLLEAVLIDPRTPLTVVAELLPLTRPSRNLPVRRSIPVVTATRAARPPVSRNPSRRALLDALPLYRRRKPPQARL